MLPLALEIGLGAWALGLGAAALAQRRLIFKPPVRVRALPPGPYAGRFRVERLSQPCPDGAVLRGWRSLPTHGPARGQLLYFGGRGENVAWAPGMSSYLGDWSVLAFNYRGFGDSSGLATESTVLADASRIHARFGADGLPRIVMGRSLGSAVALRLAAAVRPEGLVLVSPFVSLAHLARGQWLTAPGAWLIRHRLDSSIHAPRVSCPSLVLMAAGDRRIPARHSLDLARRLAGPVLARTVAGESHRSLPRSVAAQQRVAEFVRGLL